MICLGTVLLNIDTSLILILLNVNFFQNPASRLECASKIPEETSDNQPTNVNLQENLSNQSHSNNSKSDFSDQSDSSILVESHSLDVSDLNDAAQASGKTDTNTGSNSSPVHNPAVTNQTKQQSQSSKEKKVNHARRKGLEGKRLQFPYSVMHCKYFIACRQPEHLYTVFDDIFNEGA